MIINIIIGSIIDNVIDKVNHQIAKSETHKPFHLITLFKEEEQEDEDDGFSNIDLKP